MANNRKILKLAQFSLLLAILAVMCFTPLGQIPIGPIVATIAMIPVVLTGILMGPAAGSAMGFFSGLFSFIVWTFAPPNPMMAFIFTPAYSFGEIKGNIWSLVICFVPRILSGFAAAVIYKVISAKLEKKNKSENPAYILAAIFSSLVNTFGVLGGIYLFFGKEYAAALGSAYNLVLGILGGQILTNGIPEAIICAVVCAAVCNPVKKIMNRER